MNENYDDILSYYATQQLINNLTSYGCKYIKSNQFNFIKRKFSIKEFHKNNIFKNSIKINHNFSKNMITALGGNNIFIILKILFIKNYLQDWLNMRLCVNSIVKIIIC